MSALEKKLCTAIDRLTTHVTASHPDLKKPLERIQLVLRELSA